MKTIIIQGRKYRKTRMGTYPKLGDLKKNGDPWTTLSIARISTFPGGCPWPVYRPIAVRNIKPWGSFTLKKKPARVKGEAVIQDGDYKKGLERIAFILNKSHLTNDHKVGMIDSVLFGLLITPIIPVTIQPRKEKRK